MNQPGQYVFDASEPLPSKEYDFVIVGAGIYGLPLGCFLREQISGTKVLVMEDNTIPGEGITVNTGGIIRACYSNPDVMVVSAFGRPYFANPTKAMGLKKSLHTGFVPSGWGRFVNAKQTPGIENEIERIVRLAEEKNVPGVWSADFESYLDKLEPKRAENLLKVIDPEDCTHVLADDNGGYADGGAALLAFLEAALEKGVDVVRLCRVVGLDRSENQVTGVRYQRWRSARGEGESVVRETVSEGSVRASAVIVAAGAGSRKLIEQECLLRMATFPTFHQTPVVENTNSLSFHSTQYLREQGDGEGNVSQRQIVVADLPVISHWRDLYFHAEGSGLTVGAHHRELHDEEYEPKPGKIVLDDATMEVGLSQVLVDKILENMEHFPVLASDGLRLGNKPMDIAGGFYVMNPEELPFEGPVPNFEGLYYIGSGSGTGFKLGPGLAYLLAQRLSGVPKQERLIDSSTLSVDRAQYFYPQETSEDELRRLFEIGQGRFRHVGASGVGAQT